MSLEPLLEHNLAVVGITGSGKTFFANHLHANTVRTSVYCTPKLVDGPMLTGYHTAQWNKRLLAEHRKIVVIPEEEDDYPFVFERVRRDMRDVGASIQTQRGRVNRFAVLWGDEADELAPEGTRAGPMHSAVKRLRAYGVTVGVVTQAPADVAKGVLKQCHTHIIFPLGRYETEYVKKYNLPVTPGQLRDHQFVIATERDVRGPYEL